MTFLNDEDFMQYVKNGILPSIDFIIWDTVEDVPGAKLLVGRRKNAPAKNMFFVPGGIIRKSESFQDAISRLSQQELGVELKKTKSMLNGIYMHNYDDNAFNEDFGTQYIVTGLEFFLSDYGLNKDSLDLKDQHTEMVWMTQEEALGSPEVHENTKRYLRARDDTVIW